MAGRRWIALVGLMVLAFEARASASDDAIRPATGDETWFEEQASDFARSAGGQVWGVAFSKDGKRLATASGSERNPSNGPGELAIYDVERRSRVVLATSAGGLRSVGFSPDGASIATGESGVVRLRDASDGRVRLVLRGFSGPVHAVAFSPDGKTLATGAADGSVKAWDAATGKESRAFQATGAAVFGVAFSPD